jgi:hypothetical protein
MGSKQRRRNRQAQDSMAIPKLGARTRPVRVSGSIGFSELRNLLDMPPPKGALEKKQRFDKLMEAYSDTNLVEKFRNCQMRLETQKTQLRYLLENFSSKSPALPATIEGKWNRWRMIARKMHALESDICLYKKLVSQLESYASNKSGDMGKIKGTRLSCWGSTHRDLTKFSLSSEFLRAEVRGMGFDEKEVDDIYKLVIKSLDQKSPARHIDLGISKEAHANAEELAEVLAGYPQFLLYPSTVYLASYGTSSGKTGWGVGICSSKACRKVIDYEKTGLIQILDSSPTRMDSQNIDGLLGMPPKKKAPPKKSAGEGEGRKRKIASEKKGPPPKPAAIERSVPAIRLDASDMGRVPLESVSPNATSAPVRAKRKAPKKESSKPQTPQKIEKKKPSALSGDPLGDIDLEPDEVPKKERAKRKKRKSGK